MGTEQVALYEEAKYEVCGIKSTKAHAIYSENIVSNRKGGHKNEKRIHIFNSNSCSCNAVGGVCCI
jgi:hypothetical protein